jgi:hypothetical protein
VTNFQSPEKFVTAMLQELNGDRREQRGIREKERLGLEWPKIIGAIAMLWKEPWEVISAQRGNGALGLAYYLGQRQAGITLRELGRHVGQVQYPALSIAIAEIWKAPKNRSLVGEEAKTGNYIVQCECGDVTPDQGNGRPGVEPVVLLGVSIFHLLERVPDRQAVEMVKYHLGWKLALNLSLNDRGFHSTTLVNFGNDCWK